MRLRSGYIIKVVSVFLVAAQLAGILPSEFNGTALAATPVSKQETKALYERMVAEYQTALQESRPMPPQSAYRVFRKAKRSHEPLVQFLLTKLNPQRLFITSSFHIFPAYWWNYYWNWYCGYFGYYWNWWGGYFRWYMPYYRNWCGYYWYGWGYYPYYWNYYGGYFGYYWNWWGGYFRWYMPYYRNWCGYYWYGWGYYPYYYNWYGHCPAFNHHAGYSSCCSFAQTRNHSI